MSDLRELLERVKAASGPDRELDAAIMFDLFAKPVGKKDDGFPSGYLWPEDDPSWNFGIRFPGKDREWFARTRRRDDKETLLIERDGALVLMNDLRIPPLTASVDAALALVERCLPGHYAYAQPTFAVDPIAYAGRVVRIDKYPITDVALCVCYTPALAILSALLTALIAQKQEAA